MGKMLEGHYSDVDFGGVKQMADHVHKALMTLGKHKEEGEGMKVRLFVSSFDVKAVAKTIEEGKQ